MASQPVSEMQINCDVGAVRKAAEWLRNSCRDINPDDVAELELAVVEAVTNLVKHADLPEGDALVGFKLSREGDAVEVTITDRGAPISQEALQISKTVLEFDPENVADIPASGLGLAIIREATDDFDYETRDGLNIMRLVKRV